MKLFSRGFNFDKGQLDELKHLDFSLFVDNIVENHTQESPINILVLQEPNEYFGLHDYAIQNKDRFSFILTWDNKILNDCPNSLLLPVGTTWMLSEQYSKNHEKQYEISHLRGRLNKAPGHNIRWEILEREKEIINIKTRFFNEYGERYDIEKARIGKEEVFRNSQYGVAIENFYHNNWFTEKIIDCFLLKTIPLYWGCPNIGDFFNKEGIITFNNTKEFIDISNNILTPDLYKSKKDIIEENYNLALNYIDYETNIVNVIIEIFKYNNII